MSTPINDGGPAFPQVGASLQVKDGVYFLDKGGMTLRDWFAGQALAGILSNPSLSDTKAALWVANYAIEVADAMLAARAGKETK